MEKTNAVLVSDKNIIYPATRSCNVICGGLTLNNKFADDFFIIKDTGTNSFKKVTLYNGVFQFEDIEVPDEEVDFLKNEYKVLCIGNSMTLHPIMSYWWGWWAMAASKREKAWPNILYNKLMNTSKFSNVTLHSINIAAWERNLSLSVDDSYGDASDIEGNIVDDFSIQDYDLVIYRAGENVSDTNNYASALTTYCTELKRRNPDAEFIMCSNFWGNETKDSIQKNVGDALGFTWVSINQYNDAAHKEAIGNLVWGDDGQQHAIDNAGVAQHPNDLGMEAIANAVFNNLSFIKQE